MSEQTHAILSGNELVVRGGLEAGFSLYTGYPGSPMADYFNILHRRKGELRKKGIQVAIANSEANAAAMASGAKQAGRDSLVVMKSMGLQVASDALSVGHFANPGEVHRAQDGAEERPGVVVVVGDDPWSISTSAPVDSRYLFKHLHISFLEPATPQELKDWMGHALFLSRRSSLYQGVLTTTFMAEGGGRVKLATEAEVDGEKVSLDPAKFDLSQLVMVPPNSLHADRAMIERRFPLLQKLLGELNLDRQYGPGDASMGVVSAGVIFETAKQVMEEEGHLRRASLYKVASSFPLVEESLLKWLRGKRTVVVVEEKRGFLEGELKALCQRHQLDIQIWGKQWQTAAGVWEEAFPAYGGLSFEQVREGLSKCLGEQTGPSSAKPQAAKNLPNRLPTFCPGCPHRETLSLLKELRATLKAKNIDLISHGDVGCYSLSFLPPFKEMHNLSAMGQGGALGAGADLFTKNPSVVLMGDSTFFHSGITDISNSVQMGHNITYILLDNDNTAMTGHQMTPASGQDVTGEDRPRQDMLKAVEALGVSQAIEVDPSDRYFYRSLLQEFVEHPGTKVIVSKKECALTFGARQKVEQRELFAKGAVLPRKTFYQINTDTCEDCRACVESTGCPGLTQIFDAYGSKIAIDPDICVADSYCTKIEACPSFEQVEVYHYHPDKWKGEAGAQGEWPDSEGIPLPDAHKSFARIAEGDAWRAVVTGVGGSGVTTISRILAEAAQEMGGRDDLNFKFVDQKGLAQRNGNVTAHLAIYAKDQSCAAVTPHSRADLLLSSDFLDGLNKADFLAPSGQALFDEDFQLPLSALLDRQDCLERETLLGELREQLGERGQVLPLRQSSREHLGRAVYSTTMLLGAAFQSGRLPFGLSDMKRAIERTFPTREHGPNLRAFEWGRQLWHQRHQESARPDSPTEAILKQLEQSIRETLLPWHNKKAVLKLYRRDFKRLQSYFPGIDPTHLAQYVHDLYVFDRGRKSEDFLQEALHLSQLVPESDLAAIALRTLAKTFFVKDEVFVAHQLISPAKRERDRRTYVQMGSDFRTTPINRPRFDIFGLKLEFGVRPCYWMLAIMRHARLLRWVLRGWHRREREIALQIRRRLRDNLGQATSVADKRRHLQALDNIKGYREVRYRQAQATL